MAPPPHRRRFKVRTRLIFPSSALRIQSAVRLERIQRARVVKTYLTFELTLWLAVPAFAAFEAMEAAADASEASCAILHL